MKNKLVKMLIAGLVALQLVGCGGSATAGTGEEAPVESVVQTEAVTEEGTEEAADADTEEKGTPAGNAIVGFFKFLLWVVIIAAVLFVGVFVWAMFNEDVAALLQKYIFRRKNNE